MNNKQKRALYESIMQKVARQVKKAVNEQVAVEGDAREFRDYIRSNINDDTAAKGLLVLLKKRGMQKLPALAVLGGMIDEFSNFVQWCVRGGIQDLNWIDTYGITDMSHCFYRLNNYNWDCSGWDVSSVTDMHGMFFGCYNFNCDLSGWDVSRVTDMGYMFFGCEEFDCDLSGWNVSRVTDMHSMFYGCKEFNSDLSRWDLSNVTDMSYMFEYCEKFNSDLSNWDVRNVRYMYNIFAHTDLMRYPRWYKAQNDIKESKRAVNEQTADQWNNWAASNGIMNDYLDDELAHSPAKKAGSPYLSDPRAITRYAKHVEVLKSVIDDPRADADEREEAKEMLRKLERICAQMDAAERERTKELVRKMERLNWI